MKFKLLATVFSCLVSSGLSATTDIVVSDQAGMDGLDTRLHTLIDRGEQEGAGHREEHQTEREQHEAGDQRAEDGAGEVGHHDRRALRQRRADAEAGPA